MNSSRKLQRFAKSPAKSSSRWRRVARLLAIVLLAGFGLGTNTASIRRDTLQEMHSTWRYWDDMALASQTWLRWKGRLDNSRGQPPLELDAVIDRFKRSVRRQMRQHDIQPHEFWRTVPGPRPRGRLVGLLSRVERPPYEDRGRSQVLALGFLILGGMAPFLQLWLGVLLCLPVLAWCVFELTSVGRPVAAGGLALAIACSPFAVETLTLPHSAVAFYFIAALTIVALGTYAVMSPSRSRFGWALRLSATSLIFAVATIARSSTVFVLPGLALAALWATERVLRRGKVQEGTPRRVAERAGLALVVVVALLVPYLVLRPADKHNVWISIWEGLGDFGADRGYSWYDSDAKNVLAKASIEPFATPRHVTPEQERFFRDAVVRDIVHHPFWYASVLGRRVVATVGMTHLWPWGPLDGESLRTPYFHYKYTTRADWIGFGTRRAELPVPVFWLPLAVLVALWQRARRTGDDQALARLRATGLLLLAIAAGTLGAPVLVSTASGIETQVFVLVYFTALGCALDDLRYALAGRQVRRRYDLLPTEH